MPDDPEGQEPTTETPPEKPEGEEQEQKPPWESDDKFDPARAWKLIENLREESTKAKAERDSLRGKVKDHEDASKSDNQKLEERATGAETKATRFEREAARLRVALRKGLTETQAKRLVGESEEELEKDADELLESFRADEGQEPPRQPKERLRPGAAPAAEPDTSDPAKLAEQVPRGW